MMLMFCSRLLNFGFEGKTGDRKSDPISECFLALNNSFSCFFSVNSGKTVYQGQPSPQRFFPYSSVVLDFPYGNLADVGQLLEDEEVLFIMYYAPWCASCMRVRHEFEKAAKYLENEVSH